MREVGAEQKHQDGHDQQKLLRGRVLVPVVDLLPHVEVVVGARVELEGHAAHPVEHEEGGADVGDVDEGPGHFLGHAGDAVEEEFEEDYADAVDCPCP